MSVNLEKAYPVGTKVVINPDPNPMHNLIPGSEARIVQVSEVTGYVVRGMAHHNGETVIVNQYLEPEEFAPGRVQLVTR